MYTCVHVDMYTCTLSLLFLLALISRPRSQGTPPRGGVRSYELWYKGNQTDRTPIMQ